MRNKSRNLFKYQMFLNKKHICFFLGLKVGFEKETENHCDINNGRAKKIDLGGS